MIGVAEKVIARALVAASPRAAISECVRWSGPSSLHIKGIPSPVQTSHLKEYIVIGLGKASGPMTSALLNVLSEDGRTLRTRGVVVTKEGHLTEALRDQFSRASIPVYEAGHPIPNDESIRAATSILALVREASAADAIVILLLSGGGSALATLPPSTISLADIQALNGALMASGASINDVNLLRKHTSAISGGRLGALCAAPLITLILSDVIGDPLDVIASGPTVLDHPSSTYQNALKKLRALGLIGEGGEEGAGIPASILAHLEAGARGDVAETPKVSSLPSPSTSSPSTASMAVAPPTLSLSPSPDHAAVVVGSNKKCIDATREVCCSLGYAPYVLSSCLEGEAKEVARVLATVALSCALSHRSAAGAGSEAAPLEGLGSPPLAIIAGGETTVTLSGEKGRGGRNQELALAAALAYERSVVSLGMRGEAVAHSVSFLSLGTDGTDGPTDAAGAFVSQSTLSEARLLGLEPEDFLARHDSYAFFSLLDERKAVAAARATTTSAGGSNASNTPRTASTPSASSTSAPASLATNSTGFEAVPFSGCPSASATVDADESPSYIRPSGLIVTGPTGTNVADLMFAFVSVPPPRSEST
jgi:glycerate 2-kinase